MNQKLLFGEIVKVRGGEVGLVAGFETIENVRHVRVQLRIGGKVTVPLAHVSKAVRRLQVRSV